MMLRGVSCFLRSRFSRRRRLESIAFFNRISVLSTERGFSRKSYAPNLVARTAVSMVPWPEIMMTSGAFSLSTIFSRVSNPSIPGSQTSSSTTSKRRLRRTSRHASPLSATEVLYPSSSSTPRSDCRILDSSSTMRMLCMLDDSRRDKVFRSHRQLNHKFRSHWPVFLYSNRTAMVFDDAVHDGQAQSRPSLLGGKVRQKEPPIRTRPPKCARSPPMPQWLQRNHQARASITDPGGRHALDGGGFVLPTAQLG